MAYIGFVIMVLLFIFFFLYIQLRREIKEVAKQLRYTREEQSSFQFFTTSSDKNMKVIIDEINVMREESQRNKCAFLDSERKTQEMITNISHDIRTPLTSIQGYIEMMQSCENPEERANYNKIVTNRLHDLETMLDEFFVYAKLMNTSEFYTLEERELYPLVCQTLLNYMNVLNDHSLQPKVICEDETIAVKIHEESFIRICTNLIINTVRYGDNPFHIEIKRQGEDVALIFENHCTSKTMDVEHMFDRFFKGDQARNQKGSGLGLAIVKELCNHMHAKIKAEYHEDMLTICIYFNQSTIF